MKASLAFRYAMAVNVLEVRGLTKDYRQHFWTPKRRVLSDVSFYVRRQEIFGFLGPNGAGKSTTIKTLLEIIFPTSGTAQLFGKPVGDLESKRRLGFLPENPYFYEYLTAREFLEFHGGLSGMSSTDLKVRIPEVLELVGMRGTNDMHLRSFSKGMLQRIGIAQAIIHNPELVILDEPMTGLDPLGRREVRDLMLKLKSEGKTIFFSTHILSDVESVCDRVAILNKGKLLSCGSLDELISVEVFSVDMIWRRMPQTFRAELETEAEFQSEASGNLFFKIRRLPSESSSAFEKRMDALIQKGVSSGASLQSLNPAKENLEDVFLRQVGRLESRV